MLKKFIKVCLKTGGLKESVRGFSHFLLQFRLKVPIEANNNSLISISEG